jgi:hypothetical protein
VPLRFRQPASAGRIIKQGSNKVVTWVITWRYSALAYLQAKHNYATFSIITLEAETFAGWRAIFYSRPDVKP